MDSSKYRCGHCGTEHAGIPADIAYKRPVQFFMVPEAERPKRVKVNDDLCVVDDKLFAIRGILRVPIIDQPGESLRWGVWAAVSQRSFERYFEIYDRDASDEPPFRGLMAVSPPGYPDLLDREVMIQTGTATERPVFTPVEHGHPLFAEQRDGITTRRWHEIVKTAMPWLFEG
jgi:hypothetical protein